MSEKPRRPWVAVLLTLLVPGLGQLYAGEPKRAVMIYLGGNGLLIGLLLAGVPKTFPGFILFLLVLLAGFLWVIWDAARIASQKKVYVPELYNRWYVYFAITLAAGFASQYLLTLSPVRAFQIPSGSMEPALLIGDHLYADMTRYRSAMPARGDVIVFASPEDPARINIGRVIGLPGEEIDIRNKTVYIDGQRLADPWAHHQDLAINPSAYSQVIALRDDFGPSKIPTDAVFVLGDNRDNSYDSRFYGPVPLSSLQGRLLYVYWAADRSRIGTSLK